MRDCEDCKYNDGDYCELLNELNEKYENEKELAKQIDNFNKLQGGY